MANLDTASAPQADAPPLAIRKITVPDLKDALWRGYADFNDMPTHAVFLIAIYPIIGLVLVQATLNQDLLPMLYPLAGGFALLGPFAALGLYELSRRREQGLPAAWTHAAQVLKSQRIFSILALGLMLLAIFIVWVFAANSLYGAMFGKMTAETMLGFAGRILTTPQGWMLIIVGNALGIAFAAVALTISVVSFPLLLDRDVSLGTAVQTSVRAVLASPATFAAWGFIVGAGLFLGSLPLFAGLIVVLPVLGHATWHVYRKVVAR